jgi:hypothetical protein
MVEVPAATLELAIDIRQRECGYYESAPPGGHRLTDCYRFNTVTFRRRPGCTGSRTRKSRGQSIVEFANVLPVFLLLFATILDLGRIRARISVTNAARGTFQAANPTSFKAGAPAGGRACVRTARARGSGGRRSTDIA